MKTNPSKHFPVAIILGIGFVVFSFGVVRAPHRTQPMPAPKPFVSAPEPGALSLEFTDWSSHPQIAQQPYLKRHWEQMSDHIAQMSRTLDTRQRQQLKSRVGHLNEDVRHFLISHRNKAMLTTSNHDEWMNVCRKWTDLEQIAHQTHRLANEIPMSDQPIAHVTGAGMLHPDLHGCVIEGKDSCEMDGKRAGCHFEMNPMECRTGCNTLSKGSARALDIAVANCTGIGEERLCEGTFQLTERSCIDPKGQGQQFTHCGGSFCDPQAWMPLQQIRQKVTVWDRKVTLRCPKG